MIGALNGVIALLNWISTGCDLASMWIGDLQIQIEDREAVRGLIVESAARAELLARKG